MSLSASIKKNKKLKELVLLAITPKRNPKPRLWVRIFLNPFFHRKGNGAKVRRRSRIDVFPWNTFDVGAMTTIEDFCVINNGSGGVVLGDRVRVGIGSVIIGPVNMGNGSGLGQNVFVSGFNHSYKDGEKNSSDQPLDIRATKIGADSHIGANSVVLAGINIGKRCQIGAGSVVTKNIPDFSIAVGNPAKIIKTYDQNLKKWVKI